MPWLRVPRRRDGRCATSRGFLAITASVSLRRSPSKLATASVPRGAHEISRPAPRPRARGSGVSLLRRELETLATRFEFSARVVAESTPLELTGALSTSRRGDWFVRGCTVN